MRVAIVGGGVIGLYCARRLLDEGAEVTVIDAGARDGRATPVSAGWIAPALSAPLSGPTTAASMARQVLHGEAAFGVRAMPAARLVEWVYGFARSGTAARHEAGLRAVLRLARDGVAELEEIDRLGNGVELRHDGLLLVAREQRGLDEATHMMREVGRAGYPGEYEVLDRAEARRREPALSGRVAGAVHARAEAHLRPERLLGALDTTVRQAGVGIVGAEALGVEPAAGGRWTVATTVGGIEADRVVVAAGVWSRQLLGGLGVRVPLLAGVGHTITARGRGTPPEHPLKLVEPNIAVAPFGDGVRIAARFELAPPGDHRSGRSARRALRAAAPYLGGWSPGRARVTTAGMRPATPDSLPVIGRVPGADGVFVATGHGMLGLTLAPGTARELAPLVTRGRDSAVLHAFSPARFGRVRPRRS